MSTQNLRGHAGCQNLRGDAILDLKIHWSVEPQGTQARRPERKEKAMEKTIHPTKIKTLQEHNQ
jgi:hypothetical protein